MIGQTIQHYKIIDKLGEGGMGVVYKAHDTKLDRTVALKFLPDKSSLNDVDNQRFSQEARAAARLNHPNICTIHSIDEYEGQPFLVMEYVEGTTLSELIRNEPLPLEKALDYAGQIAEALTKAHEACIVHRDIKPGNIMVDSEGRAKVMDFGIAKLKGEQNITKASGTVGTIAYMAPEQMQGLEVDHRADIFSFGMVFYEMLTGRHPFPCEHKDAIAYCLVNEQPHPPESLRPEIPFEVSNTLSRCLEKDPEQRYLSADDIIHSLQGEGQGSHKLTHLLSKFSRTSIVWAAATAGIVLIAILLSVFQGRFFWGERDLPEERHIVVLPFSNLSEEAIPASLNYGIMEMMTSTITRMEPQQSSFAVVPSSEVHYQEVTSVTEASSVFGTTLAITGSVQRIGDQFRMTVNLVDVTTMRQLRSTPLELEQDELARLQPEMLQILSDMLEVEITPDDTRTLLAGGSDDIDAYMLYTEGRGHLSRYEDIDHVTKAIEHFEQAIASDAGFVRAYAGLAEACWRKYNLTGEMQWSDKAIEYGNTALELDDQLMEANLTMAFLYNRRGRYEEAMQKLGRITEADRGQAEVLRELARSYEGRGYVDRAEEIYQQAVEDHESYWPGYIMLGEFYTKQGLYEQAVDAFTRVTELAPDNFRGYANLGGSYLYLQEFEKARKKFELSLEIQPNEQALSNLGTMYFQQGNFAEAIRKYEEAIEIGSRDYRIWGNLGAAYYWSDEEAEKINPALDQAITLAKQQQKITPEDRELRTSLAGYHALLGHQDEAHSLLDQMSITEITDPITLARIAHTYEQLGAREDAINWLEQALDIGVRREILETIPGMQDLLGDRRIQNKLE